MREVVNRRQLENLIQGTFRDIADEHGVDVDLVAEIIRVYSEVLEENLPRVIIVSEN